MADTHELMAPEDVERIKLLLPAVTKALEEEGFSRAQIGSALLGYGAGLMFHHAGERQTMAALQGAMDSCLAGTVQH